MHREIGELVKRQFDVLVVGGGAAGAAAAREAALRGYTTALLEREDFGSGTSSQCFKVVHGGIRYLQHADITRLRLSCRERAVFLRLAPHLVAPMPFVVPTYGHGRAGKELLGAGMLLYDVLSAGCNSGITDPSRRIHRTRFLSRSETLTCFPFLDSSRLTGAAVFEDGQMYNPSRLVLAFVTAAHELGATVANYVEVERFLRSGTDVVGVVARDRISQESFEVRARIVINATGPWAEGLVRTLDGHTTPPGTYSRDACVVIDRKLPSRFALAVQGRARDADAVLARGGRHLLLVPWRDRTLLGVWHSIVPRDPDGACLSRAELREFISELNQSLPALELRESDVQLVGYGLVPFGEESRQRSHAISFGKRSRIIDHQVHGVRGLISVMSVRFTVARMDAEAALSIVERQIGPRAKGEASRSRPLPGGEIDDFQSFAARVREEVRDWLPASAAEALACHYGSHVHRVLALAKHDPSLKRCLPGTLVTQAEVAYAVREEMAQRMTDVVFRRTGLGTAGHPGAAALDQLQDLLRRLCGWSAQRCTEERFATECQFNRYLATAPRPRVSAVRSA